MAEKTTMSVATLDKFPWTSEAIAEELGMDPGYFRVWKNKMEKVGKLKKPAKPSLLCVEDPEFKSRLRYSDQYVEQLKKLREVPGAVRKARGGHSVAALKHALMTVTVPIFDPTVKDFVLKKFKDQKGIENHLKSHLMDISKNAINKIEALKKRHEKEMQDALADLA